MGNVVKTAEQKKAEKDARIAAAAAAAGVETIADETVESTEEVEDTDTRVGLVEDPKIPDPKKPDALTARDERNALEAGVPPLPKRYTQAYLDLRNTYVLFIRQNPEKWDMNRDDIKAAIAALKALEVK